ncbi:MAG: hypothetical protein ACRC6M_18280, partial [Microcystaceae cyanobacterium]
MLPKASPAEYLTETESAAVDRALLTQPEKFLTRLTISSLRLLKVIAAEEQITVEDLSPEQIISWFEKDAKRKQS